MTRGPLTAPIPLTAAHELEPFDCGEPALDAWLKRKALRNEAAGASRTYAVCAGARATGYYGLAAGAIVRDAAPRPMQRTMPEPFPVMVLGRLAVDRSWQAQGLGQALLRDAILRVLNASEIAGIKAMLVHAISEEARRFYLARDFVESPIDPMTLCLPLGAVRSILGAE